MKQQNSPFKTSIGGQALIEGVMMRGPEASAMAVRLPDGEIDVEVTPNQTGQKWYKKAPFIRGGFNMIDSLIFGYNCLMKSASKSGMEEEEPSKFETWLSKVFGTSINNIVAVFALILGGALAIGLFMVLPAVITGLFRAFLPTPFTRSLVEGIIKIALFLTYLAVVSKMPDIYRVFQYHGAEHKTIACYEAGLELTVENARVQTRFHPRCGTSFLLIVMVISILLFSVVTWSSIAMRILLKLLLLPVVVGISYEIIKFAGRHDNPFTRAISAPGLWLQRLTTNEPDDSQLEVAIASVLPVLPKEEGSDRW
ncbi:DUF1385 domain-containing protein [Oscillospiraceae bacterium MB08-C2-2]|nr:DUF1385 domain-containing protein [Oscillospiraceae bacterium MB08-C2-2]